MCPSITSAINASVAPGHAEMVVKSIGQSAFSDSMLRVGSEFQTTGLIEAVHGLNQADHSSAGQIVECDARRHYPKLLKKRGGSTLTA